MTTTTNRDLSFALIGLASSAWLAAVAYNVPSVYLDEFFHVRQAKQYWDGKWHVWDPKITTPPGLYLISYIWLLALGALGLGHFSFINKLRSINAVLGIPAIFSRSYQLLTRIHQGELDPDAGKETAAGLKISKTPVRNASTGIADVARNIALFPPLFFFSGLYYTDVLSVLAVLLCYSCFHEQRALGVVVTGAVSLTFRQNNIFWCAIYLAGLEVVRSLKRSAHRKGAESYSEIPAILKQCWQQTEYYDPPVDGAGVEDYLLCGVTLAMTAVVSPLLLLPKLLPYATLLLGFAAFILWNGGVVLGDKSNHVASLHLPQMLYLWVYFAFFSFPAMLPSIAVRTQHALNSQSPLSALLKPLPRPLVLVPVLAASAAAVKFNTIIHPFTLADNRHYTFYIFKILRLYPALRYLAIPVYVVCAWAALTALGSTRPADSRTEPVEGKQRKIHDAGAGDASRLAAEGNRTSFVIVWAVSSALGLVTAPLVEPRYYILPFIFWRLHVPSVVPSAAGPRSDTFAGRVAAVAPWLETAWTLLVNAVTMYIFVKWGFEWKQEPGAVQRFMW